MLRKIFAMLIAMSMLSLSFSFAAEDLLTGEEWTLPADDLTAPALEDDALLEDTTATWEEDINLDDLDLFDLEWLEDTTTGTEDIDLAWGYSETDALILQEAGSDFAKFLSPVILDGNGEMIKNYKVVYSTQSLAQLDPLSSNEVSFVFEEITWASLEFNVQWLLPNTNYYAVAVPVNKDDVEWEPSVEVNFMTQAHEAASDVTLSDLSYTYNYNEQTKTNAVTLKWTPVEWAQNLEIFLRFEQEQEFTKLWDADMNAGNYEFWVAKSGNYFVKVIPVDAEWTPVWQEVIQSVKVEVQAPEIKAPAVWPATNLLIAILLVFSMWYLGYRLKLSK